MSVIDFIKKIKHEVDDKVLLGKDNKEFYKYYSTSSHSISNGDNSARDILVYCHVVEKGLSHKNIKPLFGMDRISLISNSLNDYVNKGGKDPFIINMALSTLEHYNQINRELGVKEEKLIDVPNVDITERIKVGVKSLSHNELFKHHNDTFSIFSASRHSVRLYDCKSKPIEYETILKSIEIAQNCPSACNRQAVRVKIITGENLIKDVSEVQGGSKGFGENSAAMIIITSVISLYAPSERRMPMLDCGLFTMNLVYALLENRIGSCILNGSFTPEREEQMKQLVPIPDNEMYATVIALSNIPENETIKVANSVKRNVNDIITLYNQ